MFALPPTHIIQSSITDQSSDSNDSETRHVFPDIYTLMMKRGIAFQVLQSPILTPNPIAVSETPLSVLSIPKEVEVPVKPIQIAPVPAVGTIKKRKETKRTLFSDHQRSILMHWLKEHQSNPYPTSSEKQDLMEKTGLNRDQVNVWFTNNRVRHGMSCSAQHHGKNSRSNLFFH